MIARHTGKLAVVSKANRALDHTRKTALAYQWHSRGAREVDDSRGIAKLRLLLGTERTNRADLTMSVVRGGSEVAFRSRQDRF
jgi:hypothetical protein